MCEKVEPERLSGSWPVVFALKKPGWFKKKYVYM